MSIWRSIDGVPEIPERDNYTGAPVEGAPGVLVDVATAVSWHPFVRLLVEVDYQMGEALLSVAEARAVSAALEAACHRIETDALYAT